MKTCKKILSVFAAFAIAAAATLTPTNTKLDLTIKTSAQDHADIVESATGGLTLDTFDDPDVGENDFKTLALGDKFSVVFTIPAADVEDIKNDILDAEGLDALDSFTLGIDYNDDVFEVVQWYNTWSTPGVNQNPQINGWIAPSVLNNTYKASFGETKNYSRNERYDTTIKKGKLYMTINGYEENAGQLEPSLFKTQLAAGTAITFTAVFKVIKADSDTIGKTYGFSISSDEQQKDNGGNVIAEQHGLDLSYSTLDANGETIHYNVWKLAAGNNKNVAKVSIGSSLKGKLIEQYEFDEFDNTDIVTVKLKSQTAFAGVNTGNTVAPNHIDLSYSKDDYTFRGLNTNASYNLVVDNKWCLYKNIVNNKEVWSTEGFGVTADSANANLYIRLFGDVNNDGKVTAQDATIVLKYLVGKDLKDNAGKKYIDGTTSIGFLVANVLDGTTDPSERYLNAHDATQILRHAVELPSVFDTKP